jgi:hypothetical protein
VIVEVAQCQPAFFFVILPGLNLHVQKKEAQGQVIALPDMFIEGVPA